jgi:hypothetical protein
MLKYFLLALTVTVGTASLSCQTYTTGLEQGLARGNEAGAVTALSTIAKAQQMYSISNDGNYGSLEQLAEGGYLDARFKSSEGAVKEYVLTMTTQTQAPGTAASFSCTADPKNPGATAGRHFYIDSTSPLIHVNATQPATATDPIHQN